MNFKTLVLRALAMLIALNYGSVPASDAMSLIKRLNEQADAEEGK